MFGKNDVYVVFRVGTKKVKTHHKKNAGKHATFDEILTMNLEDHDLEHGIDVGAYDYDVGSSDDLLGQGKLVNLLALKRTSNQPRQFKEPFKYKAVWKSTSASGASIRTRREILISTQGLGAPVQKHSALHLRGRGHARLEDVRLHQVQQAGRADRRPQAGRAHSTTEEHRHAERGEEGAAFGERHDGPHPAVGHG